MPPVHYVEMDVRHAIASGENPVSRVLDAASALKPEEGLRLIAPFEPAPLYLLLRDLGFEHQTERQADGSWMVWFYRDT